jgi:hypothetical protein
MLYRPRGRNSAYRTGGFLLFLKNGVMGNLLPPAPFKVPLPPFPRIFCTVVQEQTGL